MLIVKYYIFPGVMVPYRSSCQTGFRNWFYTEFPNCVCAELKILNVCRYVCLSCYRSKEGNPELLLFYWFVQLKLFFQTGIYFIHEDTLINFLVFQHLSSQASSFLITDLAFELSLTTWFWFCSVLQSLFPSQHGHIYRCSCDKQLWLFPS